MSFTGATHLQKSFILSQGFACTANGETK